MRKPRILITLGALMIAPLAPAHVAKLDANRSDADYVTARERLTSSIRGYARAIGERADPRILRSVGTVPRHLFVPEEVRDEAYEDRPLPIGAAQTISQPSLVALMTHLLRPAPGDVVLEVGTGSGYQAALLSPLVAEVYSVEIIEPLARQAGERLRRLGFRNVHVRHGDGYRGWPERAPFDGIIVTAGASHVPRPLVDQLKPGGYMVIPLGPDSDSQQLMLIAKSRAGKISQRSIADVRFVPLTRSPS